MSLGAPPEAGSIPPKAFGADTDALQFIKGIAHVIKNIARQ